jgi:hypothetical protein
MQSGTTVVHIAVDNVCVTDANGTELGTAIAHLPITPGALDQSVTELVHDSGEVPDFVDEYVAWYRERGGIFICTVAEAIGVIEVALRHGKTLIQ